MSILNKIISYFPNKNATTEGVDTNLISILNSQRHKDLILALCACEPDEQRLRKEALPCYTVAGRFSRRCNEGIIELSGLADVDLDSAEDYDIFNLLLELKKIPSIAYAGLSCRRKRLHCIVPFLYPDKYDRHYAELINSFSRMGLPMGDSCHKTISQPRFVSWNDHSTQFFNHVATPYTLLSPEKSFHIIKKNSSTEVCNSPADPFQWCNEQFNKSHDINIEKRHPYLIGLARYCNLKGLSEEITLIGCLKYIEDDFTEDEISSIVKHIYTTQADSHNKYPFSEFANPKSEKALTYSTQYESKIIKGSWICSDGKFYIPNPDQPSRVAVYASPEAYNKRLHIPLYIDRAEAEKLFLKAIKVDLSTLRIIS